MKAAKKKIRIFMIYFLFKRPILHTNHNLKPKILKEKFDWSTWGEPSEKKPRKAILKYS